MMTQDVVQGQSRLFYWKAGDPLLWCSLPQSLEWRRNESLPQLLLYWSKGITNAWGNHRHKCPLLLE